MKKIIKWFYRLCGMAAIVCIWKLVVVSLSQYVSLIPIQITMLHGTSHWNGFIIRGEHICAHSSKNQLFLMTLINSAIGNFEERQAIRETWASETYLKGNSSRFRKAFMLGISPNEEMMRLAKEESAIHKDIIMLNINDSYGNLTHKVLAMLRWIDEECPNAQYLFKTDDDVYINFPNLIRATEQFPHKNNMMFGYFITHAPRIKDPKDKWYIPDAQYKGDIFPDYLSGTANVMPRDVAARIYQICQNETAFTMEDVLISGICAEILGIRRYHVNGFVLEKLPVTGCALKNIISSHRVTSQGMRKIWKELKNPLLKCEKLFFHFGWKPSR